MLYSAPRPHYYVIILETSITCKSSSYVSGLLAQMVLMMDGVGIYPLSQITPL